MVVQSYSRASSAFSSCPPNAPTRMSIIGWLDLEDSMLLLYVGLPSLFYVGVFSQVGFVLQCAVESITSAGLVTSIDVLTTHAILGFKLGTGAGRVAAKSRKPAGAISKAYRPEKGMSSQEAPPSLNGVNYQGAAIAIPMRAG
jgi:hypothetical protein